MKVMWNDYLMTDELEAKVVAMKLMANIGDFNESYAKVFLSTYRD